MAYMHSYCEHSRGRSDYNNSNYTAKAIIDYKRVYLRFLELKKACPNVIFINYHNFANNPEVTIQLICNIIGENFSKEYLKYWNVQKNFHPLGGNTGVFLRLWDSKGVENILKSCYWKTVYTEKHTEEFINEKYTIKDDTKWKNSKFIEKYKELFLEDNALKELYSKLNEETII